jgi:phage terminase large subunit-like protein
MLAADGEHGAEVYCGATTEKQAWAVFRPAKAMADRTVRFRTIFGVETSAESIFVKRNGSRFQPLIGDPGDGASPSCSITDEYHEHKTDDQFDTMRTGMAAREQPLAIVITTAGSDMTGPCYALQQEVQRILEGSVVDERVFGVIWTIDIGDDWRSDDALRKANPNYGISVLPDVVHSLRDEAMRNPRKQSSYKTKHLNIWVHARDPWLLMEQWDACKDESLRDDDFEGDALAWAGLDLSSKLDLSSLVYLFRRVIDDRDHYYVFSRHYAPEARVHLPELAHYQEWVTNCHLIQTDGNVIDQERISEDLQGLAKRFAFEGVGYDPWGATKLATDLIAKGLPMVEVPQTVPRLSESMKEIESLIVDGRLHHDGHPVLRWMMSNVTAKVDAKDNVFPRKESKENKIDGAVALITAMSRALASEGPRSSVYDERGVLSF